MLFSCSSTPGPSPVQRLWKSDGTAAGTVLVKEIGLATAGASLSGFTGAGADLFFTAGGVLWKSDGTGAGTFPVADAGSPLGIAVDALGSLAGVGDTTFFVHAKVGFGAELWAVAPLVRVSEVRVNDGFLQRSMVTSLTVTFSGAVTLDPGALELRRQDGSSVGLEIVTTLVGGRTVAVLTFTGPGILAGSLADGSYTLTVRGEQVRDVYGRPLDGDSNGVPGGDRAEAFFRLFGDVDGDRDVDVLDALFFLYSFGSSAGQPSYLGFFDYDADGVVGILDLLEFLGRFG